MKLEFNNIIFYLLITTILLDVFLGSLRALNERKWNSTVGINGILRKTAMIGSSIFLIVILAIFGIIFIKLQTHRKAKAEQATTEEEYATELEAVASEGEPEIADLTGLDIVSNAAPAPQGVLEGKVIHKPHMTDNTISLQKADLSVLLSAHLPPQEGLFQQPLQLHLPGFQ